MRVWPARLYVSGSQSDDKMCVFPIEAHQFIISLYVTVVFIHTHIHVQSMAYCRGLWSCICYGLHRWRSLFFLEGVQKFTSGMHQLPLVTDQYEEEGGGRGGGGCTSWGWLLHN